MSPMHFVQPSLLRWRRAFLLLWSRPRDAAAEFILQCLERRQQRRRLLQLDDHLLRDIGLSRADIEREASKPFWQP